MAFKLVKAIEICEVGPRDGLQNEAVRLTVEQKVQLISGMARAGFRVIEAGSFVSPKAVPQMADTDEVFKRLKQDGQVEYRALIANEKGVERAAACGCRKVKLNVSASSAHNLANLNCTPEESVNKFGKCVDKAQKEGIGISGSISMAFGSPWDKEISDQIVESIVKAYIAVGIFEISLSDASGMAYPTQVYDRCLTIKKKFPNVIWWLHFHNTRGLGIANMMAGMQAGFTKYDTAFAGAGGCPFVPGASGNVATEDVVHMCSEMGLKTGIDLDKTIEVGREAVGMLGHPADSYLQRAGKSKDLILELPTGQIKNQVNDSR